MRIFGPTADEPFSNAVDMVMLVKKFSDECAKFPDKSKEDGILELSCKLRRDLASLVGRSWNCGSVEFSASNELQDLFKGMLKRLVEGLDHHGVVWLKKKVMEADPSFNPRKTLCVTTPRLEACIVTVAMSTTELPQELGEDFADLVGAMPEYTKACSVSVELMKELSPDGFELLKRFTDAVENKLWDQLDVFQQSISQLRNLNKKYMHFGGIDSLTIDFELNVTLESIVLRLTSGCGLCTVPISFVWLLVFPVTNFFCATLSGQSRAAQWTGRWSTSCGCSRVMRPWILT